MSLGKRLHKVLKLSLPSIHGSYVDYIGSEIDEVSVSSRKSADSKIDPDGDDCSTPLEKCLCEN